MRGGMVFCDGSRTISLPLPVAGLMSDKAGEEVARSHRRILDAVRDAGCTFNAPYMTMSFMCLPVIPDLKLTDKGLFDVNAFSMTALRCG